MRLSAEIRWFWTHDVLPDVARWFCSESVHPFPVGGGQERTDYYLHEPHNTEFGVKVRGGRTELEVKTLVTRGQALEVPPFTGCVDVWTKVSTTALVIPQDQQVRVHKQRWLRMFDTACNPLREIELDEKEAPKNSQLPNRGCSVELTRITLASGETWLTLGFEAFGKLEDIQADIALVATELERRNAPALPGARLASYPEWLVSLNGSVANPK